MPGRKSKNKDKYETSFILGTLRMSKDLRKWVEKYCKDNKITRSKLIRESLIFYKENKK